MAEDVYHRVVEDLQRDPTNSALDTKLFQDAEIILPNYLQGDDSRWNARLTLMRHLASDLTETRRADHSPVVNLLIKLFDGWTWQQISEFGTSNVPYKDGLAPGDHMVAFNRLMIMLLSKATDNAADAAHAASMLDTMQALVRLWLSTNDTGIAGQASQLLLDLLKVDLPARTTGGAQVPSGGQGLVWKRIFGDRDVYNVFFETCAHSSNNGMSKSQKTVAQARLMEWLARVAPMDWTAISRSHHVDIEEKYRVKGGLLDFAALQMVDYKDDVLMHRCLIDFYSDLLSAMKSSVGTMPKLHDSVALQYMITHGLHARTSAIYLQLPGTHVDPLDAMFLYGPAANYIATYASDYSDHFLASQMARQVTERLNHTLELSPARWAHSDSPKHDLHLLASLPRKALLPYQSSPLRLLPSKATNADVLMTLATVFHGPERLPLTFPPTSPLTNGTINDQNTEEAAAARSLYFNYLANSPRFWQDIVAHADTVALLDLALASISCITSVITANWSTKPDFPLPNTIALPESGHLAILSPPSLEYTLPYLLKPAQSFANIVGGRGDVESAAYKIAVAKFDALKALNNRVAQQVEQQPGQGYEEILATISKRLAEGPMSREGEIGGRIGTLEL